MLANASKDPFWKAKVKHEGIENPAHKNALENTCTRCHAPMGMMNAFLNVSGDYTLDNLKADNAENFEPHHEIITSEKQVQIYEFVMGNTENEVTTILERAYRPLKDNRIVPRGFSNSHLSYDTVKVVGNAVRDFDYNSGLGQEKIVYKLPAAIFNNDTKVKATIYYEPVPGKWLKELFDEAEKDEDIQRFERMYHESEQKPVLIAADSMNVSATSLQELKMNSVFIYPNSSTGNVLLHGISGKTDDTIYSSNGLLIENGLINRENQELNLGLPAGNYIFVTRYQKKYK